MNREQAINYLFSSGFTNEQVGEVVRALTYEPTTKNNLGVDCISRKAAEDITWQDPSYTDPLNILTEVRDKIRELPSVTPQPRKGHWIKSNIGGAKVCSVCQAHMGLSNFKYCPNCGAEMSEVEE